MAWENEFLKIIKDDVRQAHFIYAREIVRLYHGEAAVKTAEKRYNSIASGKIPAEMDTLIITDSEISILDLLKKAGFAKSNSDARRLIDGKGIKINGETINDSSISIKNNITLSRGKSSFISVRFN